MIELTKGPIPRWLEVNQSQKTDAYKAAPPDRKPSPWRHASVVAALKAESAGKCIYCESHIDDHGYAAVEHIKPKQTFEDLVLEWENLGLSCNRCNTNKGHYWSNDPTLRLLNPFVDDIEAHVAFKGPLTVALLTSTRGHNTLRKLKLGDRMDLLFARMRRIEELDARLRLWHEEENVERKALFAEDVRSAIAPEREFSGVLTAYAVSFGFSSQT